MKRSVCLSAVVAVLLIGHGRVVAINGGWKEASYFGQVERSAEVVAAAKRSGWI